MSNIEQARVSLDFLLDHNEFKVKVSSLKKIRQYILKQEYLGRTIDSIDEQIKSIIEKVYPVVDLSILDHSDYLGTLYFDVYTIYWFKKTFEVYQEDYNVYIGIKVKDNETNHLKHPVAFIYVFNKDGINTYMNGLISKYLSQSNIFLEQRTYEKSEYRFLNDLDVDILPTR